MIWFAVIGACFVSVGLMVWSVRNDAIKGEKLEQAKAKVKNAIKQKEIANEQSEIAAKKTDDFDVNTATLERLSKRRPRTNR